MNLIDQYLTLENQIKERALECASLVADYIQEKDIDDDSYHVSWCNISDAEYLELMYSGKEVVLEYDDGDGWPTQWTVPTHWLDMSDEDIIDDYLVELNRRREIDKMMGLIK